MFSSPSRKRQRVGSSSRLSSFASDPVLPISVPNGFNDSSTADVILRLQLLNDSDDPSPNPSHSLDLHLHSSSLRRSRYFSALLSDRWQQDPSAAVTIKVDASRTTTTHRPFDSHVAVLQLFYSSDFAASVLSVSDALDLLPVALELYFEDLIAFCVRFIEAIPWTDDEEDRVLQILPFLSSDESRDLLARIFPPDPAAAEALLSDLVDSAIHSHAKVATVKAFVGKMLREYSDRDLVQRVLDRAFLASLGTVKGLLGEYASPDFRVAGDNDETEAIQRLNLHKAVVNSRHLLWLVERMIELRVADVAAREWSEQGALAADLQKTFRDDAWRNITPGLPSLVMRCTGRIANAVAAGSVIAPKQVRMKLVKDWLPVLNVCRDLGSPMPSGHKLLYLELEETFLRIISTLPMPDAQELLQQCLGFSTRDLDDCPHLVGAFKTWFRRANRPPHDENAT